VPYHRFGDPQAAELVAQCIKAIAAHGARLGSVMLDRLAPNVWQRSAAKESAAENPLRCQKPRVPMRKPLGMLGSRAFSARRRRAAAHLRATANPP
jgi:hypothetical protein